MYVLSCWPWLARSEAIGRQVCQKWDRKQRPKLEHSGQNWHTAAKTLLTVSQGRGFVSCKRFPQQQKTGFEQLPRLWSSGQNDAKTNKGMSSGSSFLIYDNLLLKGTQIQSWWLVPLNCAPPYNNADRGSGQLSLPEIGSSSVACQKNRVSVGQLTVPRWFSVRQVRVAVLVHLHYRLLLGVRLIKDRVWYWARWIETGCLTDRDLLNIFWEWWIVIG